MPKTLPTDRNSRAPRVRLAGTVLALIRLENGRQITAKLHQLSITGGLLHLDKPLDEAIKIEIIFHVGSSTVRNKAVMLFPMWATKGCLQPFEFIDLADEHRQTLQADLDRMLDAMKGGLGTAPASPDQGEATESGPMEANPAEFTFPQPALPQLRGQE